MSRVRSRIPFLAVMCNMFKLQEVTELDETGKGLEAIAEAFGVEPEYQDNWGRVHATSPAITKKILRAKNLPVEPILSALGTGPLVVSEDDLPERWTPRFLETEPDSDSPWNIGSLTVRVTGEDGALRTISVDSHDVSHGHEESDKEGPWSVPFPTDLAPGYYSVEVEAMADDKPHTAREEWIVTPGRAYLPQDMEEDRRIAGVNVALYGVRSLRNWGVGDFTDLKHIVDWAAEDLGVDFVGVNPLHALFNSSPYNTSPYSPSSRLFRNYIYLDVESIPDFALCDTAMNMVAEAGASGEIAQLRDEEHVDYDAVSALKIRILKEIFWSFLSRHAGPENSSSRWEDFAAYREAWGQPLESFATYCALREHFMASTPPLPDWRDWPVEYHDPHSSRVKQFSSEHEEEILFWMYLQWQIDDQLAEVQEHALNKGMLVGLYHDAALSVDTNSAELWGAQELFHEEFSIGAPPDAFAPDGQNWGFAPPNREAERASGYASVARRLRENCRHGGALRIDHVMQVHHLFWIPRGGKASEGVYVKDFEEDLLGLIALESQRQGTIIVGEDLGTLPYGFRERLVEKRLFSYRLFYFERTSDGNMMAPHEYPEYALVSINTHDLPTLAGFWLGEDIDARKKIGHLDQEREEEFREERTQHKAKIIEKLVQEGCLPAHTAHEAWESPFPTDHLQEAVLSFLLRTPSRMVMINQEDIFLDTRQQNLPATTWEHPNWVTKMRYTVEELRSDPEAVARAQRFRNLVETFNRQRRV